MNQTKRVLKSLPLKADLRAEQKEALRVIDNNRVTVLNGVAGTSKTFVACYAALNLFFSREIERITVMRPMIGAEGNKSGMLPGTIDDKMFPWILPILENMYTIAGKENINNMLKQGVIRAIPIDYIQGTTFVNECAILDESQNCTSRQIIAVITRLGLNSRLLFTGDTNQIMLRPENHSGLAKLLSIKVNNLGFFELKENYRDPIIREILEAYEKNN